MAGNWKKIEELLIQNNPFYERKYINSRLLPDVEAYYERKRAKNNKASSAKADSAYSAAQRAAKEREKAEKARLALLKRQKKGALNLMEKYDKLRENALEDTRETYLDGVREQRALNELMAQRGLYGSGYSQEKNRERAFNLQNELTDIYNKRLREEKRLDEDRATDEIPLEMMEKRYRPSAAPPKKYVDKIIEILLKEELKKQAKAQKWAESSKWL